MALYGAPVWARVAAQQKSPPADGAARGTEDRALLPYRIRHGGAYPRGGPTTGSPGGDVLQIVPTYKGDPPGGTQGASEELDREVEVARSQAWRSLMAQWQRQLADYGHLEIVRAVQPVFDRWMDGSRGLTYEMSQILSGHGCFREYLFRIGSRVRTNVSRVQLRAGLRRSYTARVPRLGGGATRAPGGVAGRIPHDTGYR
ncbi:uncharacterized protein LOC114933626 [Nylanderia fulva]|uniref:uncharacterized protein LOC114933626 n=1 Tax=Nylanderia fulva TaxID=613905 RepID=UPI0010FB4C4D|nr:uncharacterized protein LOC114933626 [Nylanderia fulva]